MTAGAQQALAIAAGVLGDCSIAVGDATYQGALQAFGTRAVATGADVRYVMAGVANPQGGWLVPPAQHHTAALELKHASDLQTASVSQAALARMIGVIDHDTLVAAARTEYARRASALSDALHRHLPGLPFAEPVGAFSIWLETGERGDELALMHAALEDGVMFDPGSLFSPTPRATIALRLSYSNADVARFDEAARRLARALARWTRRAA